MVAPPVAAVAPPVAAVAPPVAVVAPPVAVVAPPVAVVAPPVAAVAPPVAEVAPPVASGVEVTGAAHANATERAVIELSWMSFILLFLLLILVGLRAATDSPVSSGRAFVFVIC